MGYINIDVYKTLVYYIIDMICLRSWNQSKKKKSILCWKKWRRIKQNNNKTVLYKSKTPFVLCVSTLLRQGSKLALTSKHTNTKPWTTSLLHLHKYKTNMYINAEIQYQIQQCTLTKQTMKHINTYYLKTNNKQSLK